MKFIQTKSYDYKICNNYSDIVIYSDGELYLFSFIENLSSYHNMVLCKVKSKKLNFVEVLPIERFLKLLYNSNTLTNLFNQIKKR